VLKIERSKVFKKDISKLNFSEKHYAKFIIYIGYLLEEKTLPQEAKEHNLTAQWNGYQELHISGDLLLIYKIEDETLFLTRIGTHSQLFS